MIIGMGINSNLVSEDNLLSRDYVKPIEWFSRADCGPFLGKRIKLSLDWATDSDAIWLLPCQRPAKLSLPFACKMRKNPDKRPLPFGWAEHFDSQCVCR